MRILVNHFSPTPNAMTGITAYTWAITRALAARRDHQIYLCTNWSEAKVPALLRSLVSDVVPAPTSKNESRAFLRRTAEMPWIERRYGIDAILTPQYYTPLFTRAARVTVVHDFYIRSFPQFYSRARHVQWNTIFPVSVYRSDMILSLIHI